MSDAKLRAENEALQKDRTSGVWSIAVERARQETVERWSAEHDDEHTDGSLALAAVCYAHPSPKMRTAQVRVDVAGRGECPIWETRSVTVPRDWPESWSVCWWKPADRIRDLTRAGALIAAELDRLERAALSEQRHG